MAHDAFKSRPLLACLDTSSRHAPSTPNTILLSLPLTVPGIINEPVQLLVLAIGLVHLAANRLASFPLLGLPAHFAQVETVEIVFSVPQIPATCGAVRTSKPWTRGSWPHSGAGSRPARAPIDHVRLRINRRGTRREGRLPGSALPAPGALLEDSTDARQLSVDGVAVDVAPVWGYAQPVRGGSLVLRRVLNLVSIILDHVADEVKGNAV